MHSLEDAGGGLGWVEMRGRSQWAGDVAESQIRKGSRIPRIKSLRKARLGGRIEGVEEKDGRGSAPEKNRATGEAAVRALPLRERKESRQRISTDQLCEMGKRLA